MGEILYADDDELAREMVAESLESAGHTVRLVTNGTQALAEVRRSVPDLVLLDYYMGEPDGFAVCREIKTNPNSGHIPVLILTGEGQIDSRPAGFGAGADEYLPKPIDPRELIARVQALLELARRGLDRNPSSGLPGGEMIRREFERRLDRHEPFAACYLDLDNFKPFGERFGFVVSDAVIREVGQLLREVTERSHAFAGHVGGDDFVLLCPPEPARSYIEEVQVRFRQRLLDYLPEEVVGAGCYLGKDRSGTVREFPLTRISAAIVHVGSEHRVSPRELGEFISEVKDRAKKSGEAGIVEAEYDAIGLGFDDQTTSTPGNGTENQPQM